MCFGLQHVLAWVAMQIKQGGTWPKGIFFLDQLLAERNFFQVLMYRGSITQVSLFSRVLSSSLLYPSNITDNEQNRH